MDDHQLRRLIDDPGGSALARSLIASAGADVPSPDGRARAARRLGIAAGIAVGAGAGSEAGALAAAWKLAAVVLALGGVVGLALWQAPPSEPAPAAPPGVAVALASPAHGGHDVAPPPPSPAPSPVPSPLPPPALAALAGVSPTATYAPVPPRPPSRVARPGAATPVASQAPVVALPEPPTAGPEATAPEPAALATAPEPAALTTAPAPALAAPEATTPPGPAAPEVATPPGPGAVAIAAGPGRLAAEVALVDRARASLHAGDHPAALAALAEYHQRFASGDLDAEADVVTIETLIAAHELPRARALGTAFLARFPRSPLAQRVHSLLDHLPK